MGFRFHGAPGQSIDQCLKLPQRKGVPMLTCLKIERWVDAGRLPLVEDCRLCFVKQDRSGSMQTGMWERRESL